MGKPTAETALLQQAANIQTDSGSLSPHVIATPLLTHVAERSVLPEAEARGLTPFVVGGRKRIATCGGVAWFNGHHLAVVNLYGGHLRIYRLHEDDGDAHLELMHEMSKGLSFPEDVAAAPNGSLLAIAHSLSDTHGISLHPIEARSLEPRPAITMLRKGPAFHGMGFTPDSRHLAFTDLIGTGYIEVLRVDSGECTCHIDNIHHPLKPKSVAFSRDGRFAAVAFAPPALALGHESPAVDGVMTVHRFDAERGIIERDAVATWRSTGGLMGAVESSTILPSAQGEPFRILSVDQASDAVLAFDFDPHGLTLSYAGVFAPEMSFPHGVDVSADGRLLAVANYGDDTVRVLSLSQSGSDNAPALPWGISSTLDDALVDRIKA